MPDMREEFEAWATKHRMPIHRDGVVTDYAARCTDECWQAWKASRAALRVELPDDGIEDCQRDRQNSCRDNFDTGYCYATDRITQALQQAGIEVK
ncbi:hypothetical protein [Pseudomonas aeruginosa]|uniref:hypothetical protein n=1 Tax=Pseudomonas aeruginosa TaxID=287 RepID=UPI000B8C6B83|nr:hypothetical protein [Pseudomonas aeruginosa]ASP07891.1 hypothetical protein CGU46_24435 [Pseudomonas aeruginosa]ASP15646.1 hypothetical protein CGU45_31455 [Pseudomonas aeruginosa]OZO07111.1 hypothetical protein CGU47_30810 [Pseudomonas aeruginosa]OZO15809.1 hypothetical protein CGU42_20690 [Pseudomonas aeruginosa]OZO39018.1 hypothetical protein CGU40_00485 [Pseudomonas aeruginosa]